VLGVAPGPPNSTREKSHAQKRGKPGRRTAILLGSAGGESPERGRSVQRIEVRMAEKDTPGHLVRFSEEEKGSARQDVQKNLRQERLRRGECKVPRLNARSS